MNSLFYFLPTLSYFICNDFKDDGSKKKGVIISQLETNNKQFTKKEKQNGKQEKKILIQQSTSLMELQQLMVILGIIKQ